jgi:DNA-binding MarR family transcriptional regulator
MYINIYIYIKLKLDLSIYIVYNIFVYKQMADTFQIENKIGLLIWKTSNFWQSKLRFILKLYDISINEYLILQSIVHLLAQKNKIYQNEVADLIGMDNSVVSVKLKDLERKNYISRKVYEDNRKKMIQILDKGINLFEKIHPLIEFEETKLFNKLNNETFNFTNSLKLLLGKKIRIKVKKQNIL